MIRRSVAFPKLVVDDRRNGIRGFYYQFDTCPKVHSVTAAQLNLESASEQLTRKFPAIFGHTFKISSHYLVSSSFDSATSIRRTLSVS